MKIHRISGREILDSRGNPTIAATVELEDGVLAEASVPSGASTGSREALELRDNDKGRFLGQGELTAVREVNTEIAERITGMDAKDQRAIDQALIDLDGTKGKNRLGGNSILAVSLAVARAQSISEGVELFEYLAKLFSGQEKNKFSLPTPMFNILNGGKHADNNVDIQEAMIVPLGLRGFEAKLRAGSEIFHTLRNMLLNDGQRVTVGDEGGFAPDLARNEMVFELLQGAITSADYKLEMVKVSIDVAASSFFDSEGYFFKAEQKKMDSAGMITRLSGWAKKYQLYSIEDGLSEDDQSWKKLTEKIAPTISIGDDLFTTDPERITLGGKEGLANGVIIKPNQIGTLTETFAAIRAAKDNKMKVIVSHRSGETEDPFIADLAVATKADFIKAGAPSRSERIAKYNRLTLIEDYLKGSE